MTRVQFSTLRPAVLSVLSYSTQMLVYSIYHGNEVASYSVCDAGHYVSIRNLEDSYLQHTSGIHILVGNSRTLTEDFSSVRLATQDMT
jgi:hypothetical protein